MEHVEHRDTVIIGGGQAGLAMSALLKQQGRDHVVLEQHQHVGATWRRHWDSFRLVTPNWSLRLPGYPYQGNDPDGFLTRDAVVAYLEHYAAHVAPPLRLGVTVTAVEPIRNGAGYLVHTPEQVYQAAHVVVATGSFHTPRLPPCSQHVPDIIGHLHSSGYRNPAMVPAGGVLVVGSGQSGCQIAQELHESGRRVYLSTSRVRRHPRRYRGHDTLWWLYQLGVFDKTVDTLETPRQRFAANPQIAATTGGQDLNLHQFARDGIRLLGHLADIRDGQALLASDLHANLAVADRATAQFRHDVDTYVQRAGIVVPEEAVVELRDGYAQEIVTTLDLAAADIRTIIWATGYRWDYG